MHVFLHKCLILVEATGLEPTTFWSLTKRATKLRYASICYAVPSNSITYYTHTFSFSQAFFTNFLTFFKKIQTFYFHSVYNSILTKSINFARHIPVG